MTSRLLVAGAVLVVAGLFVMSGSESTTSSDPAGHSVRQPADAPIPRRAARPASAMRGSARPGGLPARDVSSRRRSLAPPAARAARTAAIPPSHAFGGSQRSPIDPVALSRAAVAPVSAAAADQPLPANGVDAAPAEERPRSRGVGGTVLEKNGSPAARVTVSLKARRIFDNAAAAFAIQSTATDGRGAFAFGEVPDGEYEVRTTPDDRYQSAVRLVRPGAAAAVLIVEKRAEQSLSVHGIVESGRGGVLEGVRVDVIGQPSISAVTDAAGAYALRIPAVARLEQTTLRFHRPGYRDRRWPIGQGQRPSDYEVIGNVRLDAVAQGLPVSGLVTSTAGNPVPNARVQLDSPTLGRGYRAISDGAGRFIFTDVESGPDYRVWVRPISGFKDSVMENVVIDAATQPLSIEVAALGFGSLSGRMVSPDGAAVPHFTMWLTSASGGGARSTVVTGDAQGRFRVDQLPEGPAALQTRAAPLLSVSGINVAAGAAVTVVVDVGSYRLDGRLLTGEGSPAAGARVLLEWSGGSGGVTSRSSRETIADADGAFSFGELGGGVHVVSATLAGAGSVRVNAIVDANQPAMELRFPGKRGRQ